MQRKKIPYGQTNFKSIIDEDYIYIDKTKYIEILENSNSKFLVFLRPRRFGKSLFVNLLGTYYDINEKNNFDKYFKDLYIGKNPTKNRNNYYILTLSFSGINTDTKEKLINSFRNNVIEGIISFKEQYNLDIKINENEMPSEIIGKFISDIKFKINKKLYVLIDEYDHFANELLSFEREMFKDVVSRVGFVRKFYEKLKDGTTSIIDRIFITGVSPITLDSMTSGFNISSNITRLKSLNEMMGFTEEEVRNIIREVLILGDNDIERIIERMRKYYNGYRFNEKSNITVYNSDMVLYYIDQYINEGEETKELIDTNISSDYKKIENIFEIGNRDENYQVLNDILNDKDIDCILTRQFNLEKEFTIEDFKSLLYYLGFLSIKGYNEDYNYLTLTVPNYVIKELYFDYFEKLLEEDTKYRLEPLKIKEIVIALAERGDIKPLVNTVEEFLKKLSNRDYIKFDEKYIKVIMMALLMFSKIYYVKSEYEVEGGYIDIALLKRSNTTPKNEALIEIKYIKKENYNEDELKRKKNEGIDQINKYRTAEELKDKTNLRKFVLVFVGEECKIIESL